MLPAWEKDVMLTIRSAGPRLCDRLTRRDVFHAGVLGLVGLSLPELLRGQARAAASAVQRPPSGVNKACSLLFRREGPPQHSTWDPKPDTPPEICGDFKPIASAVPGIQISELMPRLARQAGKLCILRGVATNDS